MDCLPRKPCSRLVIIWRTFGRYKSRLSGVASSARHCSKTFLRSSGTESSSLGDGWTRGEQKIIIIIQYVRHIDIEGRECGYSFVEIVAQLNINITDAFLVQLHLTPESKWFQQLFYRNQKPSHCTFYCRLQSSQRGEKRYNSEIRTEWCWEPLSLRPDPEALDDIEWLSRREECPFCCEDWDDLDIATFRTDYGVKDDVGPSGRYRRLNSPICNLVWMHINLQVHVFQILYYDNGGEPVPARIISSIISSLSVRL